MTTLTQSPPRGIFGPPRPLRWTVGEFHRFGDLGAFEGRGAKLIDGVIIEEGQMNPPHALTMEALDSVIRAAFGSGWRFRNQLPLILGQDTDPMPDFAVLPNTPRGGVVHPTTASLVIEAADTSLDFDTDEKRRLYARAGIADYWVIDINGRRLLVFRDPQDGDYAQQFAFGPADAVAPLAVPGASVRVADLLV